MLLTSEEVLPTETLAGKWGTNYIFTKIVMDINRKKKQCGKHNFHEAKNRLWRHTLTARHPDIKTITY